VDEYVKEQTDAAERENRRRLWNQKFRQENLMIKSVTFIGTPAGHCS